MKKQAIKVIGFDSWTGGSRHFERLLPALGARSIQFSLVHLGSWGNEPGCPPECRINDLLVRDIAFYDNQLERLLDIERPDAVIFLSTETFAHRALIRYCRHRHISTLFLFHGVESIYGQAGNEKASPARVPLAHLMYVISRAGKLLKHTLPCYAKALWKTKAGFPDWQRFLSDIAKLAMGGEPAAECAAGDSKTSRCAVYIPADVNHAVNVYGFREEDVAVVGNPDLLQFGLEQSMIGAMSSSQGRTQRSIMYIETGLSSVATLYSGTQGFVDHLIETSNSLAAQGYRLRVKLKPGQTNTSAIIRSLGSTPIEVVADDEFMKSLSECSACIVETSTISLLPALMGMPLLLANYGSLKSLAFGLVITSYPRGYWLRDLSDVSNLLLEDAQMLDVDRLNSWIDLNVGPLPSEQMPERVAAIINDIAANLDHSSQLTSNHSGE